MKATIWCSDVALFAFGQTPSAIGERFIRMSSLFRERRGVDLTHLNRTLTYRRNWVILKDTITFRSAKRYVFETIFFVAAIYSYILWDSLKSHLASRLQSMIM
jgi:hypothetical protein